MSAAPLRFPSPLPAALDPDESGVRPVAREEDVDTLPPPSGEAGDAYTHVTVVRPPSPELLAYLRALDEHSAFEPSIDPSEPHTWSDPPVEGELDCELIDVAEGEVLFSDPQRALATPREQDARAGDGAEIPSFHDRRTAVALVCGGLVIAGSVVLVWVAS